MSGSDGMTPRQLLEDTFSSVAQYAQNDPTARMRAALALNSLADLGQDGVDKDCRIILHRIINGIPTNQKS